MRTMQERFEEKYIRIPGVDCWIWTGARHTFGYGNFWNGEKHDVAHRVSYQLYVGEIPGSLNVLHKCDNPACIRPDHLFLGTHQDNIYDKVKKGRARGPRMVGLTNPAAKLTEEQVLKIRDDPRTLIAVAKEFGIGKTQVRRIRKRQSWASLNQGA